MPFLELLDETLDINSTANYQLVLQVSPHELTYCIQDTLRNKYILLKSSEPEENRLFDTSKLEEIILGDDFLARKYKKVNIITPSAKMTLVPEPLYSSERIQDYYTFNHLIEDGDIILENKISDPDLYVIFSFPRRITEFLSAHFTGVKFLHHINPLLKHLSGLRKNITGYCIQLHIEKGFFNLVILDRNTLRFCNTFSFSNVSDILYYVLNVFKKLDIDQNETIYISGSCFRYDDLYSGLSAYIGNLRYSEPSEKYSFSYVFNEAVIHRYLNLFTTPDCE
ncbi:MAG: DUF3822 family protein [Bacteroidales bacterium]|jgi:hypothetical protein|nr:DUF3822 family protein [Bacteroidales bacterium]